MKQENYVIGLDLGINNVGWSILNLEQHQIEKCGVRLFNPSDDAKSRRNARSVRRRLKRQKNRINESMKLFKNIGFVENPTMDENLLGKRVLGLKQKITKVDIINIVKYFMSHRGYIPFDDEKNNFVNLNGMFPCEYYYELLNHTGKIRALNKVVKTDEIMKELSTILDKQSEYYPELKDIKDKVLDIFSRKREFWEGPGSINSLTPYGRFKCIDDVLKYEKNKSENPLYEKYLFEDLIGKCNVLYLNEQCAPIANLYAERFNLINDFNNLTFHDITDAKNYEYFREVDDGYKLNEIGINNIIDYCFNCDFLLKIDKMFKELFNLSVDIITGFRIDKNRKIEMSTFAARRSILRYLKNENINKPTYLDNYDLYNRIIYYINVVPSSNMLIDMLKNEKDFKIYINDDNDKIIKKFYDIIKKDYAGYHSLSEKALKQSISDMLSTGLNYQQARKKFNYDKLFKEQCAKSYIKNNGKVELSDKYINELIASPQVKKTLRQSIKVINAIISEKGSLPYCISIESEKEVNSDQRKKEINNEQKIRENLRKNAINIIESNGYSISEALILKVMLYNEINGYCPYCNSQKIELKDVLDNRIEVEHIIPLSKSADNSYNNKTLSCSNCNATKGDKTPYEWKKYSDYDDFKNRILNNSLFSNDKIANFLCEDDLNKYSIRFINRNLRDTAYATKELVNQIKMFNYYLDAKYKLNIKTLSTPGQITHQIRENYNLEKNRDVGKYHHAVDASIVASITDTGIGNIIINSQNDDKFWLLNKNNEIDDYKRENLINNLKNINIDKYNFYINNIDSDDKIFISSQVNKSAQGQLADANICKIINIDGNLYKVSQINNIYEETNKKLDELFNDSSNKQYLMIRDNNPKLYEKLKKIYFEYKDQKGNPFKLYCFDKNREDSFEELKDFNYLEHGIKASDNPKSPMVLKLKYYSTINNPYILNNSKIRKKEKTLIGVDNLNQYCTEIYYDIDNNKFAFLPIFSVSVGLNKKIINKSDNYYQLMKKVYLENKNVKYITTIFNGNYIEIIKKNSKKVSGIYSCFHKTNNKLILKNNYTFTTSDLSFTIYDVDILGNKRKRLTYTLK